MLSNSILISAVSALAAIGVTSAKPVAKRADITDTTILQYALTLEHLEDTFYKRYLAQFSADDFEEAGYPDWVRNRIEQISGHEAQHVALLSGALGDAATQACNYTFPVTDVNSFLTLSAVIENVGVSAYLGAASLITTPAYVTVAGSILTTEARHQGWINSAVLHDAAWSGPEDTPLSFSPVYTVAAEFITGCPSTNPTLPFTAFPAATIGTDGTVTYAGQADGAYVALYQGLDVATFPITGGKVTLPATQGFAYAVVTSTSNATDVGDANILAGPVILDTAFVSALSNPAPSFASST